MNMRYFPDYPPELKPFRRAVRIAISVESKVPNPHTIMAPRHFRRVNLDHISRLAGRPVNRQPGRPKSFRNSDGHRVTGSPDGTIAGRHQKIDLSGHGFNVKYILDGGIDESFVAFGNVISEWEGNRSIVSVYVEHVGRDGNHSWRKPARPQVLMFTLVNQIWPFGLGRRPTILREVVSLLESFGMQVGFSPEMRRMGIGVGTRAGKGCALTYQEDAPPFNASAARRLSLMTRRAHSAAGWGWSKGHPVPPPTPSPKPLPSLPRTTQAPRQPVKRRSSYGPWLTHSAKGYFSDPRE